MGDSALGPMFFLDQLADLLLTQWTTTRPVDDLSLQSILDEDEVEAMAARRVHQPPRLSRWKV